MYDLKKNVCLIIVFTRNVAYTYLRNCFAVFINCELGKSRNLQLIKNTAIYSSGVVECMVSHTV